MMKSDILGGIAIVGVLTGIAVTLYLVACTLFVVLGN